MNKVAALLLVYAIVSTWWIWKEPARTAATIRDKATTVVTFDSFTAGETARKNVTEAFLPLKESLKEPIASINCFGEFDDRVRHALEEATAIANNPDRLQAADNSESP